MSETEIRSVLVPVTGVELLLPNATVAEMVGFSEPDPIPEAVDWVLGTILWHGWQVPVISYSRLIEKSDGEDLDGARICILKTLIDTDRMPYMAIVTQGHPRLVTITEDNLEEIPTDSNPIAVAGWAEIDGQEAVIPDLDRLGHLVAHAAFGALPLTS
ncbi:MULTISPECIES: chemotaxis protein CheW [unclassified Wenzhouxiangella]|uniref:chemotaxis protein CheW n=1 Tax=unclassified Wenzhouxiangella TaxID=2613841 RepID=UPI000E32B711|nr:MULTISPECIES: chemotaxis protein CheW [unclassified Wenzhouxiangella]RFF28357.1 chemotaxis protein CheW [Wenzhouxiangella sp. 15181]RFP69874.1 chemotaxis protein CheW [Wenzhouxiangella sp. 15190]